MEFIYVVILILSLGGGQRSAVIVPGEYETETACEVAAQIIYRENKGKASRARCIAVPVE